MTWVALAVNILFVLFYAPLMDGIERQVRARLQCRKGPPITQTWWDLLKLLRRPPVAPEKAVRPIFNLAPLVAFAALLTAFILVPTLLPHSITFWGDLILVIYLMNSATLALVFGGFASQNPYAHIGADREVNIFLVEELALAFVIVTLAIVNGSLTIEKLFPVQLKLSVAIALIAFAVLVYIASARIPFDIPEAEPEIVEGALIEYSGSQLAFAKYAIYLKRLLLFSLLLNFVLPRNGFVRPLLFVIALPILSIIYASIEAYCGRYRVTEAIRLLKRISVVTMISWVIAIAGW